MLQQQRAEMLDAIAARRREDLDVLVRRDRVELDVPVDVVRALRIVARVPQVRDDRGGAALRERCDARDAGPVGQRRAVGPLI